MNCEYCNFDNFPEEWEIGLYQQTSYKYEGKKYFLEVEYPADGKYYHRAKPVEVNYCPMCGRKLNMQHKVFR